MGPKPQLKIHEDILVFWELEHKKREFPMIKRSLLNRLQKLQTKFKNNRPKQMVPFVYKRTSAYINTYCLESNNTSHSRNSSLR